MNSNDAAVEVALLGIAKDLLQASDDLAATDPSASAKLAHEAYEIGRDLGIVRNHLDSDLEVGATAVAPETEVAAQSYPSVSTSEFSLNDKQTHHVASNQRVIEEEGDDELFRILDRQRDVVPNFPEHFAVHESHQDSKQLRFEVAPRRSGWFSWMRSRDLSHVG